jgi:hypothetical protein
VVVTIDVGADGVAGLLEGLELLAPDQPLLELGEPGLDEGLALGVAVAAAAMRDAVLSKPGPAGPRGERGAVVRAEREYSRPDGALTGVRASLVMKGSPVRVRPWA